MMRTSPCIDQGNSFDLKFLLPAAIAIEVAKNWNLAFPQLSGSVRNFIVNEFCRWRSRVHAFAPLDAQQHHTDFYFKTGQLISLPVFLKMSPSQQLFCLAAMYQWTFYDPRGRVDPMDLKIFPELPFGPYRVDFVLEYSPKQQQLIVECDGHEFHEKTKEQVAKDKKRNRYFTASSLHFVHFTGSEIWRDPTGCAKEAIGLLDGCDRRGIFQWITGGAQETNNDLSKTI
jgi:very-short-patch-repair endonuclease